MGAPPPPHFPLSSLLPSHPKFIAQSSDIRELSQCHWLAVTVPTGTRPSVGEVHDHLSVEGLQKHYEGGDISSIL